MNRTITIVAVVAIVGAIGAVTRAQQATRPLTASAQPARDAGANWPLPLGGPGGTRYSTLTQINTSNVSRLQRAWTFHTEAGRFSGAPMVIDSVMYFSANTACLHWIAVTGTQIWKYVGDASKVRIPRPAGLPMAFGGTGEDGGERGPGDVGTALRGPTYWRGPMVSGAYLFDHPIGRCRHARH